MENENEPESASTLAWLWVIEALASFKEVHVSLLHDVIEMAPELPDRAGKDVSEMIALRCLEGFFGPINGIRKDVSPAQNPKVTFDSSESCEDVLQRILYETSESALRVGGSEMSKWDVSPFIAQKRACMRCNLQQLKDTILDGTHPFVDFLMEKSGLASINKRDNIPVKNDDRIELSRRLDSSFSDPQSKEETSKQTPLPLEDERRLSAEDPSSFSQLPSKRSRIEFSPEDGGRQSHGCDDVSMNIKKFKQQSTHTLYSGEEAASPHGTGLLEDSSERVMRQNESDDANLLDESRMETLEEDELVKDHSGSKRSGQCIDELHQGQSCIPCNPMTAPTHEGEKQQVIGIEKVKDGNEFAFELKASNNSPVEETLHKTSTNDSDCGLGHYHHVKATNTVSDSGFLLKTVAIDTGVNMNLHEEEKDTSSGSDGYHNGKMDIAMKKNEFFSSQCMINHDSFVSVDGLKLTLCVKCNKGDQLLSCKTSDCPLVVHENCLGSSVRINDRSDFYCPFCVYSLAISEYLEAKKKAALTKKDLATFIHIGLEHQPKVIKERLPRKDLSHSVQDVVEICEDVDLGNKDNQVNPDGEHVNEVNGVKICEAVNLGNKDNQVNPDGEHINEVMGLKICEDVNLGNKDNQVNPDDEHVNEVMGLKICEDVNSGNKDNQVNPDGEHVNEVMGLQICEDVNLENKDNQVNPDGEHVNEVIDHQFPMIVDSEQIIKLSESFGIANSKHGENEANPLRVAPDVLDGDKDGDGLVDHECEANTEAELEDSLKAPEHKYDIHNISSKCTNILHADHVPVEAAAEQEVLRHQTGDNKEEPVYALNIEGAELSDDDNDESIISNYTIRFRRRKYHHTCPATPQFRRKKLLWTDEEEETLKEGVRKFSSSVERSPTIPWKKILEFGSAVFLYGRTPIDLKDKWRNLCRSPKFK